MDESDSKKRLDSHLPRQFLLSSVKHGLFVASIDTRRRTQNLELENRRLETRISALAREIDSLRRKSATDAEQKELKMKQRFREIKSQVEAVDNEILAARGRARPEALRELRAQVTAASERLAADPGERKRLTSPGPRDVAGLRSRLKRLARWVRGLEAELSRREKAGATGAMRDTLEKAQEVQQRLERKLAGLGPAAVRSEGTSPAELVEQLAGDAKARSRRYAQLVREGKTGASKATLELLRKAAPGRVTGDLRVLNRMLRLGVAKEDAEALIAERSKDQPDCRLISYIFGQEVSESPRPSNSQNLVVRIFFQTWKDLLKEAMATLRLKTRQLRAEAAAKAIQAALRNYLQRKNHTPQQPNSSRNAPSSDRRPLNNAPHRSKTSYHSISSDSLHENFSEEEAEDIGESPLKESLKRLPEPVFVPKPIISASEPLLRNPEKPASAKSTPHQSNDTPSVDQSIKTQRIENLMQNADLCTIAESPQQESEHFQTEKSRSSHKSEDKNSESEEIESLKEENEKEIHELAKSNFSKILMKLSQKKPSFEERQMSSHDTTEREEKSKSISCKNEKKSFQEIKKSISSKENREEKNSISSKSKIKSSSSKTLKNSEKQKSESLVSLKEEENSNSLVTLKEEKKSIASETRLDKEKRKTVSLRSMKEKEKENWKSSKDFSEKEKSNQMFSKAVAEPEKKSHFSARSFHEKKSDSNAEIKEEEEKSVSFEKEKEKSISLASHKLKMKSTSSLSQKNKDKSISSLSNMVKDKSVSSASSKNKKEEKDKSISSASQNMKEKSLSSASAKVKEKSKVSLEKKSDSDEVKWSQKSNSGSEGKDGDGSGMMVSGVARSSYDEIVRGSPAFGSTIRAVFTETIFEKRSNDGEAANHGEEDERESVVLEKPGGGLKFIGDHGDVPDMGFSVVSGAGVAPSHFFQARKASNPVEDTPPKEESQESESFERIRKEGLKEEEDQDACVAESPEVVPSENASRVTEFDVQLVEREATPPARSQESLASARSHKTQRNLFNEGLNELSTELKSPLTAAKPSEQGYSMSAIDASHHQVQLSNRIQDNVEEESDEDGLDLLESPEESPLKKQTEELEMDQQEFQIKDEQVQDQKIHPENEKLQVEDERLQVEDQRLQVDDQRLQVEDQRLQVEDERLQFEDEKLQFEDEKLQLEDERLQLEDEKLQVEDERLQLEDERLQVEDERLQVEDERLQVEDEKLQVKDEKLQVEDEKIYYEDEQIYNVDQKIQMEDERLQIENDQQITVDDHFKNEDEKVNENQKVELEKSSEDFTNPEQPQATKKEEVEDEFEELEDFDDCPHEGFEGLDSPKVASVNKPKKVITSSFSKKVDLMQSNIVDTSERSNDEASDDFQVKRSDLKNEIEKKSSDDGEEKKNEQLNSQNPYDLEEPISFLEEPENDHQVEDDTKEEKQVLLKDDPKEEEVDKVEGDKMSVDDEVRVGQEVKAEVEKDDSSQETIQQEDFQMAENPFNSSGNPSRSKEDQAARKIQNFYRNHKKNQEKTPPQQTKRFEAKSAFFEHGHNDMKPCLTSGRESCQESFSLQVSDTEFPEGVPDMVAAQRLELSETENGVSRPGRILISLLGIIPYSSDEVSFKAYLDGSLVSETVMRKGAAFTLEINQEKGLYLKAEREGEEVQVGYFLLECLTGLERTRVDQSAEFSLGDETFEIKYVLDWEAA